MHLDSGHSTRCPAWWPSVRIGRAVSFCSALELLSKNPYNLKEHEDRQQASWERSNVLRGFRFSGGDMD